MPTQTDAANLFHKYRLNSLSHERRDIESPGSVRDERFIDWIVSPSRGTEADAMNQGASFLLAPPCPREGCNALSNHTKTLEMDYLYHPQGRKVLEITMMAPACAETSCLLECANISVVLDDWMLHLPMFITKGDEQTHVQAIRSHSQDRQVCLAIRLADWLNCREETTRLPHHHLG